VARTIELNPVQLPSLRTFQSLFAGSEVDQGQVTHLVPGQTEPGTGAEVSHRADRDGYPPLAPEVTLVEQNVSHMTPAGQDGQPRTFPMGPSVA
jgi:hypothetical protein